VYFATNEHDSTIWPPSPDAAIFASCQNELLFIKNAEAPHDLRTMRARESNGVAQRPSRTLG
jgi:hypothetical protein